MHLSVLNWVGQLVHFFCPSALAKRWDGMGWDGMGWDGMGWDGMGVLWSNCCIYACVYMRKYPRALLSMTRHTPLKKKLDWCINRTHPSTTDQIYTYIPNSQNTPFANPPQTPKVSFKQLCFHNKNIYI